MDLLTPARTWAPVDAETSRAHGMPAAQRAVMFLSVVGPFAGLIAAVIFFWGRGVGPLALTVMAAMYCVAGFGTTIGFHRLLTHRAFETYRPIRLALAICGSIGGQGAVIRWCATHRRHHQLSDREGDPHSPHAHDEDGTLGMLRGFWHAHVGWCFKADPENTARSVPDLLEDRAMVAIDRLYFLWVALGIAFPAALLGLWTGTWAGALSGALWGGLARIFVMQHVTWSVNSVCHVWGDRPFRSGDHSTNNLPVALLSLGEGWHNNHHAFPTSARHGLRWWQFDSTWLLIRTMELARLAWNVRLPTEAAMEAKAKVRRAA